MEERKYTFYDRYQKVGILQLMEKNGYIERVPVEYDARLKKIVVLPKGLEASAAVDADIRYVESKLQDGLTEEELEIFRRAAKKMLRNLQQSRDGEEKG